MKKQLLLKGQLPIVVFKDGDWFVATSYALKLSSFGSSFEEAIEKFEEVLAGFIDICLEKGTFHEVLLDCGWEKSKNAMTPPQRVGEINIQLEPLNEKIDNNRLQRSRKGSQSIGV